MKNRPKLKKILIAVVSVLIVIVFMVYVPPLIIISSVTGKVEYSGEATREQPLQAVYQADDFDIQSNDMMLVTDDGYEVFVSEVLCDEPKGIVVFLSGIQQPSVTYFYPQAKWLKKNGYAAFLLEVRGHGKSEGKVSLGCKEYYDVRAVVEYIETVPQYKDVPITLMGVSMGGAVAVNSFGSIEEVDGVIAMSAYSSFGDVAADQIIEYYGPKWLSQAAKHSMRMWLKVYFGSDGIEMSPVNQITNADGRKVFLIASAGDKTVPVSSLARLAAASDGETEIWIRDSHDHFIIKDNDFMEFYKDEEYCNRILEFLDSVENDF
ncbi:MAG: alpha/beta fold hydrolase [Christensenellaceae bacterium]|nr:alpha/beta fold hydrolase [Christensenellaceae bacterium]